MIGLIQLFAFNSLIRWREWRLRRETLYVELDKLFTGGME